MAGLYFSICLVEALSKGKALPSTYKALGLAALLGFSFGLAVLLRPLFLLILPFVLLWVWYSVHHQKRLSSIPFIILTVGIIVVMILPFTLYNYLRFDRFVLLNTNSGYAFFWGNHPVHGTHFYPLLPSELGSYQDLIPKELLSLDEAALEKELMNRGVQFVFDDPLRIILLSFSRIPEYIKFWPSSDSGLLSNIARVTSFGLLWPFMLIGVLYTLFWRRPKPKLDSPIAMLLMYVLIYSVIHILTWTLIRYRLPVDAVMLIFAAYSFVVGLNLVGKRFPSVRIVLNELGTEVTHRNI
jgi:hypothetical protein